MCTRRAWPALPADVRSWPWRVAQTLWRARAGRDAAGASALPSDLWAGEDGRCGRPQPVPAAAEGREGAGIEPLPPYDLRHAFASLQVRAGLSIPELAEQFGQSPAMTLNTYAHVIRERTGEPIVSAQEQIEATRRKLPGRFRDADAGEADRA